MAGLGGAAKLSVVQQDAALADLLHALLSCERWVEKGQAVVETENDEIASICAALERCMNDIQGLMLDVDEGHSRLSGLNADELTWMIDFLVKEVKELTGRLRSVLALSRSKGR